MGSNLMGRLIPLKKLGGKCFETCQFMAIKEAKNLETLSLNEFISYLFTHEMRIKEGVEEENVEKNKVAIALKFTTIEESDSSDDMDEDKEMSMFDRIFKRFMRSNRGRKFQKKEKLKLESSKEKEPIICYECKKSGQIKFDCPQ
ncbi:uncharacterized protein LOC128036178 [Gossypium raimondii]|uniref:uncharacterized protein LOC128036178 n=1 Tax=Gossypium raimondii TaxID=29730 RepID=UPI00227A9657|nr:uncharacterized protein LOC128036178 [Gossypium raimondii]